MPERYEPVVFRYGSKEEYDRSDKDNNTVFFCYDTREIYVGATFYSKGV